MITLRQASSQSSAANKEKAVADRPRWLVKPEKSLWPNESWRPEIQLAVGIFLAPLITMIIAYTLVGEVYRLTETDIQHAAELSARFWTTGLFASYKIAVVCTILTVAVLWLPGRRNAVVWMAVGAVAGALVGLFYMLWLDVNFATTPFLVFGLMGAWNMVFARWVARVREVTYSTHRGGKH